GVVVTRAAFDEFMQSADPDGQVMGWIGDLDGGRPAIESAATKILALLTSAPIPDEVASAIKNAASSIDEDRVSVRSSATCEDGLASAWAGQLETFLNVGPDEVLDEVRACWLSMFSTRALAYGAAHGYGHDKFGVAVVVQAMVPSEISGIGFSVHPVTQEPDLRLIEACFGQGEAIVSGRISPDQYVVKRGATEIVETEVGAQREGLFLDADSPEPVWRDLPKRGAERKLSDDQVLEYAAILDRVEAHYGHPVDTEWAYADGQFYLLQSRPITTLADEYREKVVDDAEPWIPVVRRPLNLLETSIISHWMDSRHAGLDLGFHVDRFMCIQDASNLAQMYVGKPDMEAALEFIRDLDRTDRDHLIAILDRGEEGYRRGQELLDHAEEITDIDQAAEHLVDIGKFTTAFPAWTLMALDAGHIEDPEVIRRAERLRSNSLYPKFARMVMAPIAERMVCELGGSEPERAGELATWRELHERSLTRDVLEQRLEGIRAGRRFVMQTLGQEERVDFVTETGYLMMRLAGQRQVVPPDDPDRISGQAAWPGVHRGRARVLLTSDPTGHEFDDGDVLVSLQSNPNLMPLLRHAGAIVTDDGGVACHAGIICRELKIPTIIGTGRATSTIHDGDIVEVDAMDQVVRIIERAS
ncbi:MAG: PEP-utilizing enzyme, partial [Pirellulales bacterium]|nr:PEP-utilizing enzyme [Pirellulales bacterium]